MKTFLHQCKNYIRVFITDFLWQIYNCVRLCFPILIPVKTKRRNIKIHKKV